MTAPKLPSDDEVVSACEEHSLIDTDLLPFGMHHCLMYPPESPVVCIKYKYHGHGIAEEARNQQFAFEALMQLPEEQRKGIRIPEVYRVIETKSTVHIVMEYIPGQTLHELIEREGRSTKALEEQYNQIEKALKLFLAFKVPSQAIPGPVGGGIIRHPIFKDAEAPIKYDSVYELQDHIFRVANCRKGNNLHIDFMTEDMCFCFSDLFECNFIFTDTGTLYVIDFTHASFLPASFMTFALNQHWPVCRIKDRFDLPQGNMEGMRAAGYYFLISWRKLGLQDDQMLKRQKRIQEERSQLPSLESK